ncbi:unnamed protein product [Bursaphelenchus xylophilus]|uniref:(pine wood nematode) hypothetical protein n=1 Tax=Bursaphelenchus xylophilus TaxID=6326 RepID=A0A1I7RIA0_BURXY|nr:unnamed protein product [Bursaphelenchus xylophilus]CAG9115056.1 unnamed protein product [Bursaphelenchus xylophilus]
MILHLFPLLFLVTVTHSRHVCEIRERFQGWYAGDVVNVTLKIRSSTPAEVVLKSSNGSVGHSVPRVRVHLRRDQVRIYGDDESELYKIIRKKPVEDVFLKIQIFNDSLGVKINRNDVNIIHNVTPFNSFQKYNHGFLNVHYDIDSTTVYNVDVDDRDRLDKSLIPKSIDFSEGQCLNVTFNSSNSLIALLDENDDIPLQVNNAYDNISAVYRKMVGETDNFGLENYDYGQSSCNQFLLEYTRNGTLVTTCSRTDLIPHPEKGPPNYRRLAIGSGFASIFMSYNVTKGPCNAG